MGFVAASLASRNAEEDVLAGHRFDEPSNFARLAREDSTPRRQRSQFDHVACARKQRPQEIYGRRGVNCRIRLPCTSSAVRHVRILAHPGHAPSPCVSRARRVPPGELLT